MARESIGIMGGTFDPVHSGHIAMAKIVKQAARLDRVLMLPTGNPPHKTGITPAEDRWRMLCAAIAQEDGLEPCRMEIDRKGVIYTFDTLTQLHKQYPKADFYYVIGADTLLQLKNWHRFEEVLKMCTFLVCPRPWNVQPTTIQEQRKRLTALGGKFIQIEMQPMDISSSGIRADLAAGRPTPMLPVVCREYAGLLGLYGMKKRCEKANEWLPMLFESLTRKRFAHTLAVAHTARHLALMHQENPASAETAALLHDCAKCMPIDKMQQICQGNKLTDDKQVLESGALMHSLVGSYVAQHEYGVSDPEILAAIQAHTTGRCGMSRLAMIVYLADKTEPTRQSYPVLEQVRMIQQLSLERGMLCSMQSTSEFVRKKGKSLHSQTIKTMNWLKQQIKTSKQ